VNHLLLSELTRSTAEVFVAGLWQGLALTAVIALCLRLLPRTSASVRFAIWTITFALVAAIPFLHQRSSGATAIAHPSAILHASTMWASAIASFWVAFSIARLAFLIHQSVRLHRIWKSATPITAPEDISQLLHDTRNARLCTSADIDSPCVIGFLSPRLLIPEALFHQLTPTELRQIVLHECEHLRRRDDWLNLAQKIAVALFPLNPALLFVDRRLSYERELACDAGVISRTSAPFDYARCLTRLAEHRLTTRRISLALSAWTRRSELARRVHAMLKPVASLSPAYTRASLAGIAFILGAGAIQLTHAPHLVSFVSAPNAQLATGVDTVYRPSTATPVVPVVYKATGPNVEAQPHATLLKANMPAAKPSAIVSKPTPGKTIPRRPTKLQQPRVLRTAYQLDQTRHTGAQAYYVTTEFTPSYAAVPFGDGWLIIQL
jgi:beta-lactamase regulating signal transducer with metallopeptidase domain